MSVVVPACGGSSSSDDRGTDDGDTGSSGDDGNGRSGSGTGGRSSSAGSDGMSGGAGRDGGRGGRDNGGGRDSGGGESNVGEGGTKADAGAGSGGAPEEVPPELLDRCDTLCESIEGAECSNDESAEDCARGCKLAARQPKCVSAFETLFECTEDAEFVCDDSGQATPVGCEEPFTLAAACVLTNSVDPALEEPCSEYCSATEAAQCATAPLGEDCAVTCQLAGGALPACSSLWKSFLTCSEDAEFSCNEDGTALPAGCEVQLLVYLACAAQATQ